ncbi:MAG: TerB family tellurite resistance protein [Thermoanaerobaculia bacterium]
MLALALPVREPSPAMFWKKVFQEAETDSVSSGDTETVRRIVSKLEAMDVDEARYVAAFAYILGRVAHADQHISVQETQAMETAVSELSGLPEDEAILVVQIAKSQNRLFGGTENFLVTRELATIATAEQKEHLLDCVFAISAADDSISSTEESQIRQIASELGFSHREYVLVRSRYSEKREVMRSLRQKRGDSE